MFRIVRSSSSSSFRPYRAGISRYLSTISTEIGLINTTTELNIKDTRTAAWPAFQILDNTGKLLNQDLDLGLSEELAVNMYTTMNRVQCIDDIFYNAQRQGRISFYMQHIGEEGLLVGSAASLDKEDMVFAQYREVGVLLWRGFTLQQIADQCFSNKDDLGKGRQMPVHYGSKELNFQTIASPLATQMPQAVGAAYSYKLAGKKNVAVCYFGEGAASEGDCHAAFNFAATLEAPIIFICRNNGYAISTPASDQYRGDGIVSRAAGYGMRAIRVDGNDILAMKVATEKAREVAIENGCPVLIEAMSYRGGHHSTSDDSTRYRSISEIKHWQENFNPLQRFRKYMEDQGWWDNEKEQLMKDSERLAVLAALEAAEGKSKPDAMEMFKDVYYGEEPHLLRQEEYLRNHLEKYGNQYKDDHH